MSLGIPTLNIIYLIATLSINDIKYNVMLGVVIMSVTFCRGVTMLSVNMPSGIMPSGIMASGIVVRALY
jgi:hypothetical protein